MTVTLTGRRTGANDLPTDSEIFVRLTSGASRIRATDWEQATRLRRKLHEQGWICTSPSPSAGQQEYCFFVSRGPATVRRNLIRDLQAIPGLGLAFETE